MSRTPSTAEVLARALESRLADVWTGLPGEVTSYDPATRTAEIRPLVSRMSRDADGEPVPEDLPILPSVPVLFLRAGGCLISMRPQAGDTGLLLFCSLDPSGWRANGNATAPLDHGKLHGLGSAVFLPGWVPDNAVSEAEAETALCLIGPEVRLVAHDATEYLARADRVDAQLDAIETAISSLAGHTHEVTGLVTGPPDPVPSYSAGSTACDSVKGV